MATFKNVTIEQLGEILESLSPSVIFNLHWIDAVEGVGTAVIDDESLPEFQAMSDAINAGETPPSYDPNDRIVELEAQVVALEATGDGMTEQPSISFDVINLGLLVRGG